MAPQNGQRGRKVARIPKERLAQISALYCDLRQSFKHEAPRLEKIVHESKTYKATITRTIAPLVLEFFRSKGQWNNSIFPYVKRDKSNLPALWLFNSDHKQYDFLVNMSSMKTKAKGWFLACGGRCGSRFACS